jgi:hypothetical protein
MRTCTFSRSLTTLTLTASLWAATAGAAPVAWTHLQLQAAPQLPSPSERPASVPSSDRVVGVHISDRRTVGSSVGVFATEAQAERSVSEPYSFASSMDFRGAPCFYATTLEEREFIAEPERQEWPGLGTVYAEANPYSGANGLTAVRVETFVSEPGKDRLDAIEFWLDPNTTGQRLIERTSLELQKVATPSDGVEVFVARTGRERVEVVVRRQPSRAESRLLASLPATEHPEHGPLGTFTTSLDGVLSGNGIGGHCGHLRFHLEPASEELLVDPGSGVVREVASVTTNVVTNVIVPKRATEERAESVPVEFSVRPLTMNFGLSRTSPELEPVLSVSYRWSALPQVVYAQAAPPAAR